MLFLYAERAQIWLLERKLTVEKSYKILVINLGSTSSKVAVYEDETPLFKESISHSDADLAPFGSVWDQYDYRMNALLETLARHGVRPEDLDCIVCRGGNTGPIPGGIFEISAAALQVMKSGEYGTHPSDLGSLIGFDLGQKYGKPVITVDPPVTDEYCALARYSGVPQIPRRSSFHALNQKATARKVAADMGSTYEALNMVVIHLGGGISVGAHQKGRVIDSNNSLYGDGPFSPERAGAVPNAALINLCFSGEYTKEEMLRLMTGRGGLMAYLGTNSGKIVEDRALAGDEEAREVYLAMAYQIAKEAGSMAAVLAGQVDAIAITGSLARSPLLMDFLKEHLSFIAPIHVVPGENEMEALAAGALRYLRGEEPAKQYAKGCGL